MDLDIRGRKAIVCASSQGLGKACALALAEAGVAVVINARNRAQLESTAAEIRKATGVEVIPVAADVSTPEGQEALLAACPAPDILVNNNGGPPYRDFRELDRAALLAGVTMNMVTPIELVQRVIDGMAARRFGRIGLTAFLAGIARSVADKNVTINSLLPGSFDTARLRSGFARAAQRSGLAEAVIEERARADIPARRFGHAAELGRACAFLCSAHAGYITGQSLVMDGGEYPGTF
jgi:3-oxoacyl-[acyl-carrier protein] reductase